MYSFRAPGTRAHNRLSLGMTPGSTTFSTRQPQLRGERRA
ncbi:hypothetical protein SAMN04487968_10519 [Nocardioides terrae]|uniref:Uncharacterized protein n=1 Tax=Nocardioides terrae TaxID=574651 RepID=A0A1I1HVN8_9ACTN|nr:hypothetical protein SAMN04487968_10519 [Nocardioides terrae]